MGVQLSGKVVEGNVRRMQTARHEGYRKSLITAVDSAFPKATKRPSAATTHTARASRIIALHCDILGHIPVARDQGRFLGRPRGRSVHSRPNRRTVPAVHAADPYGVPRCTDRRSCAKFSSLSGSLTLSTHWRGHDPGLSASGGPPDAETWRLDHGHCSARCTRPRRTGFRSTYRKSWARCLSRCTGKALKRPR